MSRGAGSGWLPGFGGELLVTDPDRDGDPESLLAPGTSLSGAYGRFVICGCFTT